MVNRLEQLRQLALFCALLTSLSLTTNRHAYLLLLVRDCSRGLSLRSGRRSARCRLLELRLETNEAARKVEVHESLRLLYVGSQD